MRRVLLSALLTATLLAPAARAETLVFEDHFTRDDEFPLSSWTAQGIGEPGFTGEFFFGHNNLNLDTGTMAFSYWMFDGEGSSLENNFYQAASATKLINVGAVSEGDTLTLTFAFTPGDARFDYAVTMGPDVYGGLCYSYMARTEYYGAPPSVPCGAIGLRLTSGGGFRTTKPLAKQGQRGEAGDAAVGTLSVPSGTGFSLEVGGYPPYGEGETEWYVFNGAGGNFYIYPGQTYLLTVILGDDGVAASITDGESLTQVSTGSGCEGDCKSQAGNAAAQALLERFYTGKRDGSGGSAQIARTEEPPSFYLSVADGGMGRLSNLADDSLQSSAVHRFDDFVLYAGTPPPPEPQYTITAEVEAKGKFKKQPIDIRKKGVLQATVYGDNSGEDALDVMDIRLDSVTFGATGSETTTPALEVRYAHVDKDGVLDAIFDFAKSAAVTPCGTTSVTITGDFDVEGGFARFSGADNRVKVTGCPRTKNRN